MARGARETLSWLEHDGSHGLCNALKSAPLLLPSLSFFSENQTCVRVRHEAGQETTTTLGFSLGNLASSSRLNKGSAIKLGYSQREAIVPTWRARR